MGEMRCIKNLVGKPETKIQLGRHVRVLEDNIMSQHKEKQPSL
jgi:hypothetical protein